MGVIEAIKRGFGIATKMLPLVAVLFIFNAAWNIGSIPLIAPGTAAPTLTAGAIIFSVVFILASIFIQGSSLGMVKDQLKTGSSNLSTFLSYGIKYYLKLLALGLVIVAAVGLVFLITAAVIGLAAQVNQIIVTVIAVVVTIVMVMLGLTISVLLIMSPYVLVCDGVGVITAIKISVEKVKKIFWKVLGLLLLMVLISLGIGFVVGFLTGLATIPLPQKVGQIIIGIVNSAFNSYLGIVMLGAFMAFYLALAGAPAQKPKTSLP